MSPEIDIEKIAAVQHEIWSHWMKYLFLISEEPGDGTVIIDKEKADRWRRQMTTDYNDLTEKEKESDRTQAKKVINVLW